jgi:hypothetical protein
MGSRQDSGDEPGGQPGVPGPGRDPHLSGFADGGKWDAARPSGALTMALEAASGLGKRCPGATDEELAGMVRQWQAVESWAAAGKLAAIRAMIRSHASPQSPRHEDLPDEWTEPLIHALALAMASSAGSADRAAWLAWQLEARLSGIGALLDCGLLTLSKARMLAEAFEWLTDHDAAEAERMLLARLAAQPDLTWTQLAKLAAQFACTVDPEQAERRRKDAEKHEVRVKLWREQSGAVGLSGRNLPADEALAAMAAVNARADLYKAAGIFGDATMDQLRALAYLDLLNAIPPTARIARAKNPPNPPDSPPSPQPSGPSGPDAPPETPQPETPQPETPSSPGTPQPDADQPSPDDGGLGHGRPGESSPAGGCAGDDAPNEHSVSAEPEADVTPRTDLIIPLVTLLGQAERPGEAHGLGPLDAGLCRDLAATAARHPASRLCVTVTDADGFAIGHGCAKPTSGRAWSQAALPARVNMTISLTRLGYLTCGSNAPPGPWAFSARDDQGPPGGYGTWDLTLPDGRQLTLKLGPVPTHECDHRHESHGYQPNDNLRHLVQVRDGDCTFPPCSRHAHESDFEHALPYDQGGRTCACNAGARSRRCHRVKQSPGWKVTQPKPGWHQWTTPAGRVYIQEPKRYPV